MKNALPIQCLLAASLFGSLSTGQDRFTINDVEQIGGQPFCAVSIEDQSAQAGCIPASTVPTLGMLYPLSSNLFVDPASFVGVNTTSPLARLHVVGCDIGASLVQSVAQYGVLVEDIDPVLTLASQDLGSVSSVVSMPEFSVGGVFQDHWAMYRGTSSAGSDLRFSYGTAGNWFSNPTILNLAANGNVGIATTTPIHTLDVNGTIITNTYFLHSDARLKDDVRDLDGSLEKLRALRGVSFNWDAEEMPEAESERQLGFLAQEVREVVPEIVREDPNGGLSVAYTQVVPLLVEAMKEQDAELQALRRELAELRERLR